MDHQIAHNKVVIPSRRGDLVSRQRLLDFIYELLDHKLVLLSAPAGSGKTSLLIDLAHKLQFPVCWLALDASDQEPRRFIQYVVAAISQRFPKFGARTLTALESSVGELEVERLATTLANEFYDNIGEHWVLILDDYHLVESSRPVENFVNRLVQDMGENCHLILSSRSLVGLPDMPDLVAHREVGGLSYDELAFRAEEIQSLVLRRYKQTMPRAVAEELARETDGWITGLLLSTETMWQGVAEQLRLARVSGVGLYDFLAQQVLDQQSDEVSDLLLRTSVMGEFNAELCEAVLGENGESQTGRYKTLINSVLRNNLFVLPVGEGGEWLRYHHLFQEFLQKELDRRRPGEKELLLRRLARTQMQRQEWERAYETWGRIGDDGEQTVLIEQGGPALLRTGKLATLAAWLESLPLAILEARSALLSLQGGVAVMQGDSRRGLALLERAAERQREEGDEMGLARTLVRHAVALRFNGRYPAALADAEEALELTRRIADGLHLPAELRSLQAEALRVKGISLHYLGDLAAALACLQQATANYQAVGDEHNAALARVELGMTLRARGEDDRAQSCYEQALYYWRHQGNLTGQLTALNNLAVLHHLRGEYEKAGTLLEEGLELARQTGFRRFEAVILAGIGDVYCDLEAHEPAEQAYREAREIARRAEERGLLLYLDLREAGLARQRGEMSAAQALLARAQLGAAETGSRYEQGLCDWELGSLYYSEGRRKEAIASLEQAVRTFEACDRQPEAARAHLRLALVLAGSGEDGPKLQGKAREHLRAAFETAARVHNPYTLVVGWPSRGEPEAALERTARGDPALVRQVAQHLDRAVRFRLDIPRLRRGLRGRVSTVPLAPPRLTIQAFGRALVKVDGRRVLNSEWGSLVSRDLLYCLLAHPEGLSKEQIGLLFWPDLSGPRLKMTFKNVVYRLRRALRQDAAPFEDNLYRFNSALDYEYDVESFLSRLEQARQSLRPAERAAALGGALRLYQGEYLKEISGEWVEPRRVELRRAFLEAVMALARHHLEAEEHEQALRVCQRGLAEDPAAEGLHRLAMRAHAAMGNREELARQYGDCQMALAELGADPSSQTRELYGILKSD